MAYSALLSSMVPCKQIADLKRGTNRINNKPGKSRIKTCKRFLLMHLANAGGFESASTGTTPGIYRQ
ncbi:hypothetical protein GB937_001106 [Aspergillus fischeri]|nr:hypothetical protein GB937_001106 [Aspergillus fischeri]